MSESGGRVTKVADMPMRDVLLLVERLACKGFQQEHRYVFVDKPRCMVAIQAQAKMRDQAVLKRFHHFLLGIPKE